MWIWLCQICFLVECVLKPKLCSADPSILLGLVPMLGTWREDCEGQRETCGSWRQKSQKHFYTISSFQVYICISHISKYQKKHDATHVIMDHKSWSSSSPWPKDQDLLSRWGQAWKLRKFFARQLFFLKHTSLGPIYRTFFPWESSGDNLLFIFFRWTVQHFPHDFFFVPWIMGFWGETSTHKGVGYNLGPVEVSRLQSYTSVPGLRDDDGGLKASEARPVLSFVNVSES